METEFVFLKKAVWTELLFSSFSREELFQAEMTHPFTFSLIYFVAFTPINISLTCILNEEQRDGRTSLRLRECHKDGITSHSA